MVTSGYSMDLYCDCKECESCKLSTDLRTEKTGFAEYGGRNFKECKRNARANGWRFSLCNCYCFAPGHEVRVINNV